MTVIRRALRVLAVASVTLVLSTCSDEPLAPGFGQARLSIRPVFPANTQLGELVLNEVHLTIVRPPQEIVLDRLVSFASNNDTLSLDLSIPLQAAREDLQFTLEYRSSGTLLFSGTRTVTVLAGPPGTNPPPAVPLTYVGPGATIGTLDLQPKDSVVTVGGTLPLRISARDAQNNAIASFYVSWSSSKPGNRVDGAGLLTAGPARAVLYVKAVTPSGVTDSARVTVVPLPTQVQKDSGDAQSAFPGQPLAQPLVVRVLAADGLGVKGVPVVFAAATGGGSVDSANVVTDSTGRARTRVALGSGPAESFTATAAGLAPVTFTATATVLPASSATLAAGGQHTCQLRSGAAVCWGDNTYGQLGDGTRTRRLSATPVGGGLSFSSIVAGQDHACALTAGGQAYCWGHNLNGALGDGTTADQAVPTAVSGGLTYVSLTAGAYYTCGLTGAGKAYCWGNNGRGNLGDGTTTFHTAPTPVTGGLTFTALAAGGDNHTCGLVATGEIYCWGYNFDGELGDSSFTDTSVPSRVASGSRRFTGIAAATFHNCALDTTGAAYCWGDNNVRQLGDGSSADQPFPVPVVGGRTFTAIRAGVPSCGIDPSASQIYCWGFNPQGQIGDGTTNTALSPVLGAQGQGLTILSLGPSQSCGIGGGVLLCWGQNSAGQLGDGSTVDRLTPAAVRGPATAVAVSAGNNQSAAVGTAVAIPPAVAVSDAAGPLPGVAVAFAVASGGGSVTGATAVTDAAGVATAGSWILGPVAGANTLTATADAPGVAGNPVTFTASGTAPAPVTYSWTGAVSTDWSNAANWSGGVVPGLNTNVTIPGGTPFAPRLTGSTNLVDNLLVQSGATLDVDTLAIAVTGNLDASGGSIIGTATGGVSMVGTGATVRGTIGTNFLVNGTVSLAGRTVVSQSASVVTGSLNLAGNTLVVDTLFSTNSTGQLIMQNPSDSLIVAGDVAFAGGPTTGLLTNGLIFVGGSFAQLGSTSPLSFDPSGANVVIFNGTGPQSVIFQNPLSGGSHFQDVTLANTVGGLSLNSPVTVLGQTLFAFGVPRIVTGNGNTLYLANLDISDPAGATFDDVLLNYDSSLGGSTAIALGNVTFQNYSATLPATSPVLSIRHPGAASTITFSNLTFAPVGAGVTTTFLQAIDSDGTAPLLDILITSNVDPVQGSAQTITTNNATVAWQPVP